MNIRLAILTLFIAQIFADENDYICIDFEDSLIKTKSGSQIYWDSPTVYKDLFSSKKKVFKPEYAGCKFDSALPNCQFEFTLISDITYQISQQGNTQGISASYCSKCDRKDRNKLDLFAFFNETTGTCIVRLALTAPSTSYFPMEEPPKSKSCFGGLFIL